MQSEPWFLLPTARDEVNARIDAMARISPNSKPHRSLASKGREVEEINIVGPIVRRSDWMTEALQFASYDAIRSRLLNLSSETQAVVLNIDSTGGIAGGIVRVVEAIRSVSAKMPIVACVDGYCCSAAYYLASACDHIYCTPDAIVGSIGTVLELTDRSKLLERVGVKTNLIVTGDLKAAGHPDQPLTDEHREYFQSFVDTLGKQFFSFVASRRRLTAAQQTKIANAGVFIGRDAMRMGLVDGIALPGHITSTLRNRRADAGIQEPSSVAGILEKMAPKVTTPPTRSVAVSPTATGSASVYKTLSRNRNPHVGI